MSRRKAAPKRKILPDPLFGSKLLAKFINITMVSGKKAVAEKIVYDALDQAISKKTKATDKKDNIRTSDDLREKGLELFENALDAVRPTVEVKSRRIGGANYQVPIEVSANRGTALAMRWLVESANARNEKTMAGRLANEMLDAVDGKGGAIKKRETAHSTARANQAFAHFRW